MNYITGTINHGLAGTDFANSGSILSRFGDSFSAFFGGISDVMSVPLFLVLLFILGVASVFISQNSK